MEKEAMKLSRINRSEKKLRTISSSSSNSELIRSIDRSNLSDDLIFKIVSRLPLGSLLRFRRVCKSWWKFISELDRIKDNPIILFNCPSRSFLHSLNCTADADSSSSSSSTSSSSSSSLRTFEVDYPFNRTPNAKFHVLGSCNGLICIQNVIYLHDDNPTYLWNPSTNEFKMLPDEPIEYPSTMINVRDKTIYGFGCNRAMDNYKLLRIVQFDTSYNMPDLDPEVKIYTLGTNSWRKIEKEEYTPIRPPSTKVAGLCFNGALHWQAIISPLSQPRREPLSYGIISFDIEDEKFRVVPKPQFMDYIERYVLDELHVFRGCLSAIYMNGYNGCIELWTMKDYGVKESWTKLFKTMDPLLVHSSLRPLCFFKNGEVLIAKGETGDLVLYDPKSDKAKFLNFDPQIQNQNCFTAEIYIESSVSLKQDFFPRSSSGLS